MHAELKISKCKVLFPVPLLHNLSAMYKSDASGKAHCLPTAIVEAASLADLPVHVCDM